MRDFSFTTGKCYYISDRADQYLSFFISFSVWILWLFIDNTQWHTHTITHRLCRTPLDEGLVRRGDPYLRTYNIHKRQTSMLTVGFEPAIPASERPQTYALNCTATGIGGPIHKSENFMRNLGNLFGFAYLLDTRLKQTSISFHTGYFF
jgi:hypothetical protein